MLEVLYLKPVIPYFVVIFLDVLDQTDFHMKLIGQP